MNSHQRRIKRRRSAREIAKINAFLQEVYSGSITSMLYKTPSIFTEAVRG